MELAAGIEAPTLWLQIVNTLRINNLALGTTFVHDSQMLLVFIDFGDLPRAMPAKVGNASVQGVGTELGTQSPGQPTVPGRQPQP